jgi:chromate reductase
MGACAGMLGTVRAQYHLRQACVFLNMHSPNDPEVMAGSAQDKIDKSGRLVDAQTRGQIREMIEILVACPGD